MLFTVAPNLNRNYCTTS